MKKDFKGNIIRERGKGSMVVRIKGGVRGPGDPGEMKVNVSFTPETKLCALAREKIKISWGRAARLQAGAKRQPKRQPDQELELRWEGEHEAGHLHGVTLKADKHQRYEAKMHLGKWKEIPKDKSMEKTPKAQDYAKITYVNIVAELTEDSAKCLGDWKVGSLKIGELETL
jgi:hypothetical protein